MSALNQKVVGGNSDSRPISEVTQEIYDGIQELYEKGKLVKALDDKGQPTLKLDSVGQLQPVLKLYIHATPEELVFWCSEHPGRKLLVDWRSGTGRS